MIVVSYADFFANPSQYQTRAQSEGIKILPQKKEKKLSRRQKKALEAFEAVKGILPADLDVEKIMEERYARQ